MKRCSGTILLLLFFFTAQAQTFKGGALLGINASQVDGDNLAGYDKVGLNGGFFADLPLPSKFSVSMELLYSQKGSSGHFIAGSTNSYLLRLGYAEVPFLLNYHDKPKINFGTGVSISRLVSYKEYRDGIQINQSQPGTFRSNELAWVANGNYVISDHFIFNLRFSYSIFRVGQSSTSRYRNEAMFNNVITARIGFIL